MPARVPATPACQVHEAKSTNILSRRSAVELGMPRAHADVSCRKSGRQYSTQSLSQHVMVGMRIGSADLDIGLYIGYLLGL